MDQNCIPRSGRAHAAPPLWAPLTPRSSAAAVTPRPRGAAAPTADKAVHVVLPGLDKALYQDASHRRLRQHRRQQEAWKLAQQQAKPQLSRASKTICQARLERELRDSFESTGSQLAPDGEGWSVPRSRLSCVLEDFGLFGGCAGEARLEEETFCAKLGLLLDKEDSGSVTLERLSAFLMRAQDQTAEAERPVPFSGATLEEECFGHLERQLTRTLGRLLANRLCRPKMGSSPRHTATTPTQGPPVRRTSVPCAGAAATAIAPASTRGSGTPREAGASTWRDRFGVQSPRSCGPGGASRRANTPCSMTSGSRRAEFESLAAFDFASLLRGPTVSPKLVSLPGGYDGTGGESTPASSRCNHLYQQAMFAAHQSASIEKEIKALREKDEMRECTFRPRVLGSRPVAAPAIQPRSFEASVSRMRAAHDTRRLQREERLRIPAGENYARLRKLQPQPFSCYFREPASSRRARLLYCVDVDVGPGRSGRIGVHEGDNLRAKARSFAKAFQLDGDVAARLEEMLHKAYKDWCRVIEAQAAGLEDQASPQGPTSSAPRSQEADGVSDASPPPP